MSTARSATQVQRGSPLRAGPRLASRAARARRRHPLYPPNARTPSRTSSVVVAHSVTQGWAPRLRGRRGPGGGGHGDLEGFAVDHAQDGKGGLHLVGGGPLCATCGFPVGIFPEVILKWRHYRGSAAASGAQQTYDPGHGTEVAWCLGNEAAEQF